mmetsp:Transcript_27332/g.38445  ORF Transcript_27332/g.38445 Transcript_27332/m.38445 type:complete len:788 (-) Transcript_27332:1140-3503(-)
MSGSDKVSPEWSTTSNSLSSPESRAGNSRDIPLALRQHPPSHVFNGEWFEIEVGLDIPKGSTLGKSADVEVHATLHDYKTEGLFHDDKALIIDPPLIQLSAAAASTRYQKVKCKIEMKEGEEHPSDLSIRFVATGSSPKSADSQATHILPVSTKRISVVKYMLEIKQDDSWESIWYKDEGGRDKCMAVTVGLYNKDKKLEKGKKIALSTTLYYETKEGPVLVSKQDILRSLGSSKQHVDKKTGSATLRFRIEDVSKNHQGQDFIVQISTDDKLYDMNDVAPAYTPSVSIRSKRNKRQRISASTGASSQPSSTAPGASERATEDSRVPPNVMAPPHRNVMYPPTGNDDQRLPPLPNVSNISLGTADVPRLREAIKGVMSWTDEVVNGLRPLQWQVIGYAQNSDGSTDYNRPYYNMQNPNATLSRLLTMYSESTWENIRILQAAVDNAKPISSSSSRQESESPSFQQTQAQATAAMPGMGAAADTRYGAMETQAAHTIDQRMQIQGNYGASGMYPTMITAVDSFGREKTTEMDYASQLNAARGGVPMPGMYPTQGLQGQGQQTQQGQQQQQQQQIQQQQQSAMRPPRPQAPMAMGGMVGPAMHSGGSVGQDVASLPPHLRQKTGMQADHQQRMNPLPMQDSRAGGHIQYMGNTAGGDSRESEVEYVLAKQFKSMRTGERLGFPAYSAAKELLGFYRESSMRVGVGQFVPISRLRDDFGHVELLQATQVLEEAIAKKSEAVHALKDWGSISNLIDHALVYDWSKDMGDGSGGNNPNTDREGGDGQPKIGI